MNSITTDQPTWRILVVEDEPIISGAVERALRSLGHTVSVAEDGISALHMAHVKLPDVILLDVNMPGRDGFEVLDALKDSNATRDIAVIMVTAQRSEGYIVAGLRQARASMPSCGARATTCELATPDLTSPPRTNTTPAH